MRSSLVQATASSSKWSKGMPHPRGVRSIRQGFGRFGPWANPISRPGQGVFWGLALDALVDAGRDAKDEHEERGDDGEDDQERTHHQSGPKDTFNELHAAFPCLTTIYRENQYTA
jgi:hypothetical protein